jgi:hypothetical protein
MAARAIEGLSPQGYGAHRLHAADRQWLETNCSVDLWIELLHSLGRDPVAALGVTARLDFEGDQFTFFKLPPGEVEALTGVELCELSLFDDLLGHLETQIARGRVPLIEVDAFVLPDTRGVSYGVEHSKTTIGINALDRAGRRIEYFHNAGYFELAGADFDALFARGALFPYCEYAKIHAAPRSDARALARDLLRGHLARRPAQNPVARWAQALPAHAERVAQGGEAAFHKYAFNTCRQLGANFELMADHLDWLDPAFAQAAADARALAAEAKIAQMKLARLLARRRAAEAGALAEPMVATWDRLFSALERLA